MALKPFVLPILLSLTPFAALAEQVPQGTWKQTSSTAGDCPSCTITIYNVAPHIIEIHSNNDWVGFAYYNQSTDSYTGAMEWTYGNGGTYANHVFLMNLTYERQTLTTDMNGPALSFSSSYRLN